MYNIKHNDIQNTYDKQIGPLLIILLPFACNPEKPILPNMHSLFVGDKYNKIKISVKYLLYKKILLPLHSLLRLWCNW